MEKKMTFNYFYGTEADQFSFYRIPKTLFTDQAPTLYDVVPKEEIAEFEELMRKTIADIVSEASSVRCLLGVCAEICEAQNPKRNAARIARRRSIHPSYGYLV